MSAQGASLAVNHREEGYLDAVLAHTDGGVGVDIIAEMLANVNLGSDLRVLARGGIVAVVGSRGDVQINPRDLMMKESSIVGVLGGTSVEHAEAFAGINAGTASRMYAPLCLQTKDGIAAVAIPDLGCQVVTLSCHVHSALPVHPIASNAPPRRFRTEVRCTQARGGPIIPAEQGRRRAHRDNRAYPGYRRQDRAAAMGGWRAE